MNVTSPPEKPQRISIYTVQVLPVFMSDQGLASNRQEAKPWIADDDEWIVRLPSFSPELERCDTY